MRRNLIFGIFGAIYGTGLFILAFGAAGFGEGTPSIFLLVSAPLILPFLAPFLWMGIFILLNWKRVLFVPAMLLHYLGAAAILALREDWDHFFFVEGRHPWLIALPLILYFAGQLGLWIAFVLGSADSSARRKRKMTAALAGFTVVMLGMTVLWSHMKGLYLAHSSSNTHYNLGFALAQRDNHDGAIAEYRKAIALWPGNSVARFWLGDALAHKGEHDGAIAEYRKVIALDPRNPSSHMRLGIALVEKGDYGGAITEYQKAIALEPHQPGAHNHLGYALMRKGEYDGAIAEYRQAIALEPDDAGARYNLDRLLRIGPREKEGSDETQVTGERRDRD